MFCKNCGAEYQEGAGFCPNCGAALREQAEPQNAQQSAGPEKQLKTDRSFIKLILLTFITCGIYSLITYGKIANEVNLVCSRHDGKKTMNYYLLIFIITPITLGIAPLVWMHNICNRIGDELKRRQIDFSFSAKDYWLWGILGSLIVIGPFIFAYKFFEAINKMNASYNKIG